MLIYLHVGREGRVRRVVVISPGKNDTSETGWNRQIENGGQRLNKRGLGLVSSTSHKITFSNS